MSEHTPGPWSAAHRMLKCGSYHTQVFCEKGKTIAWFEWYPKPTVNGVTQTYREANAKLCSAAPELLKALEWYVEYDEYINGKSGDPMTNRLQFAKDAIDKAKGISE